MPTIETTVDIAAPPERVWDILTDFSDGERTWDPFFRRLEGPLRPGAKLTVTIGPPGGSLMTFRPRVLVADGPRRLSWLGRLLVPGVFDGRHEFLLDAAPNAGTRLLHRETFTGVLTVLAGGMLARSKQGFEAFNVALKQRAESR
jgi:hypothetical protein